MQKYQDVPRKMISGLSAFLGLIFPVLASSVEPISTKVMEHQLGERIDKMENIIPVIERSKTIEIALPYFNRYPHFTEQLIGQAIRYFPLIERVLEKYQLPEDLKYIPFFESGFREDATSPVGARGLWQFMEGTGEKYGLTVSREIDERLDFVKSTEAAARFLKSLHEEFGSWALALLAYNGGPYRVKRLIRDSNSSDIEVIMNQMPKESQTYLSKMIAAKLIFKTYKFYGLAPKLPDPLDFYSLNTTYITSLDLSSISQEYNIEYSKLRQANPHLKYRKIRNAGRHTINVRIPQYAGKGVDETFFRKQSYYISSVEELEHLATILKVGSRKIELANEMFDHDPMGGKMITLQVPISQYRVLDKKFGPPAARFLQRDLNEIRRENLLTKVILSSSGISPVLPARKLYYLKSSESLLSVAKRFKISLLQIKEMNPDLNLYVSNRFFIPVSATKATDIANAL